MSQPIAPGPRRGRLLVGGVVLGIAFILPALTLIPLGSLWLWQNGLLLWWIAGAALLSGAAVLAQRVLLARITRQTAAAGPSDAAKADEGTAGAGSEAPDPTWSPREIAAWADIEALARAADPAAVTQREALLALGLSTVEAAALRLNPGTRDPLLQFTVPEALTLIARVAQRLKPVFTDTIPLGDQLTVAGAMRIWRWRGALDWASRAWEVWRLIRVVNPATAIGNEVRERLTKLVTEGMREEIARRLVAAYVREVGRAAIDLYGGRLKVSADVVSAHVGAATAADRAARSTVVAEPVRILVAGQVSVGKSSLINALAAEVRVVVDALPATRAVHGTEITIGGTRAAMLVDTPGLAADPAAQEAILSAIDGADLMLWVVAATRADREVDRIALAAVRGALAARTQRNAPPILLVLTHIDRLRPLADWDPPFDVVAPQRPKEIAIRAAMEAVAADLSVALADIVPVALAPERSVNVDLVWSRIVDALPAAEAARLSRVLEEAAPRFSWSRLAAQATAAGRIVVREAGRAVTERRPDTQPPPRRDS